MSGDRQQGRLASCPRSWWSAAAWRERRRRGRWPDVAGRCCSSSASVGATTGAPHTVPSASSGSGTPTPRTSTWRRSRWPAGTTSQAAAGAPLLHLTGAVDHGDEAELIEMMAACTAAGVRVDALTASEAASRWPGLRFTDPVVYQPDGGRVDADRTLAACWDQAAAAGADVRFDTPVTAVRRVGDGVAVTIGDARGGGSGGGGRRRRVDGRPVGARRRRCAGATDHRDRRVGRLVPSRPPGRGRASSSGATPSPTGSAHPTVWSRPGCTGSGR